MAKFQVSARSERSVRVGRSGQIVAAFEPGRWIRDQKGEVEGVEATMKLAAPWRGMRYRLELGGREIASAARPIYRRGQTSYQLEMSGRAIDLTTVERHAVEWVLSEDGVERGRYRQRDFDDQNEWNADFSWPEDEPAFAAFVAWLTLEAGSRPQR